MKPLAFFVSIGLVLVGLFFGFQGKQDFEKYENTRILLNDLSEKHGKCRWVEVPGDYLKSSVLECPTERMRELQISISHDEYKAKDAKEKMIGGFAAALGGPIAIFLCYIFLTKVVFPKVKKGVKAGMALATSVQNQAVSLRDSVKEAQARKVVEHAVLDETARVATRAAMTVFDEKEVAALQKQINDALAKGDYETAQALMSTLRKIEGK